MKTTRSECFARGRTFDLRCGVVADEVAAKLGGPAGGVATSYHVGSVLHHLHTHHVLVQFQSGQRPHTRARATVKHKSTWANLVTYTCARTHTHARMRARAHTHTHTHTTHTHHTHTPHERASTHKRTRARAHTHARASVHTRTHKHARASAHARICARTHTHTHTHTPIISITTQTIL